MSCLDPPLSTLDFICDLVPLSLLARATPHDVTAVFYHTISDASLPHVAPLYGIKTPEDFELDLVFLQRNFTVVSHDDLVAHRTGTRPLPPRAAAISFDDGFAECFTLARPLLRKHGLPATFFVCNGFIDNQALMYRNRVALCVSRLDATPPGKRNVQLEMLRQRCTFAGDSLRGARAWLLGLKFSESRQIDLACECLGISVADFLRDARPYMTRDQIGQLHAEGFTIGAHTDNHPQLHQLGDWNDVREQIRTSCDLVRTMTGRRRVPFAFPFNGLSLSRQKLKGLMAELDSIDLMYDTNNLMRDSEFIVNRIWCDTPHGADRSRSNLSTLIGRAHVLEPARALKRRLRRAAS